MFYLKKKEKKKKIFTIFIESVNTNLPALVSSSVVRVIFSDVGVYSIQSELFIWSHGDRLDNQLCIRVGRFRVIL